MELWPVDYKLSILVSGGPARTPSTLERPHVSDIIRDLALSSKFLAPKFADKDTMSAERVELGIAWEERLSKHHPEICFHPGEICVNNIAMSIDGVSYPSPPDEINRFACDGAGCLHEFKLTWKSMNRDLLSEWMWMAQIQSYLHGLSVAAGDKVRVAYLHVFWVNGNYKYNDADPDSGPNYRVNGLRFSDLEISENWSMINKHADRMRRKASGENVDKEANSALARKASRPPRGQITC